MNVQVRRGVGRVVVLRIELDAARVLTHRGLPGRQVGHVQGIDEPEDRACAIGEVNVVVDGQAGGIRSCAVDLDRVVLARRAAVTAGVEENVVPETPGDRRLSPIEGVRSTGAGGWTAADVNAVVKETIRAEGFIDAVDAGGAGIGRGRSDRIGD